MLKGIASIQEFINQDNCAYTVLKGALTHVNANQVSATPASRPSKRKHHSCRDMRFNRQLLHPVPFTSLWRGKNLVSRQLLGPQSCYRPLQPCCKNSLPKHNMGPCYLQRECRRSCPSGGTAIAQGAVQA